MAKCRYCDKADIDREPINVRIWRRSGPAGTMLDVRLRLKAFDVARGNDR